LNNRVLIGASYFGSAGVASLVVGFGPIGVRITDTYTGAIVQDPDVEASPERDLIGVA